MSRKAWQMKKAKNAVQPGAPALEKGLDLLEALAAEARGLSQKQLAERVGRSVGEIFRMLVALERRGYVTRDPATGEYTLTLKTVPDRVAISAHGTAAEGCASRSWSNSPAGSSYRVI